MISFREKRKFISYDSGDDLITPINYEQLLLEDEEDKIFQSIKYKCLSDEEGREKLRQTKDSNKTDTTVISSSKSPLKMVFKKTSSSMTVSPSVTPTPPVSSNLKTNTTTESFTEDLRIPTDTSPSTSQVKVYVVLSSF